MSTARRSRTGAPNAPRGAAIGRRDLLLAAGAGALLAPLGRSWSAADGERPNIVFILADDMGYGDLSCLNPDSRIPTPNIDRIAVAGSHFTDAHSPSALCTPTRYGILTGRYCWRTRIERGVAWGYSRHLIEPERVTVASLLSEHGYATGCFGKWHLGMDMPTRDGKGIVAPDAEVDRRDFRTDIDWRGEIRNGPNAVGFDRFHGISASLDMHPYIWIENDGFVGECTTEQDLLFITTDNLPEPGSANTGPSHADFVAEDVLPEITRQTVEFIRSQSAERPFFACMSLTAPHIPIVPSKPYQGLSELGPYGDFCIEVDDSIGRVLDALDAAGLAGDTMVIFTADNGCAPYIGVEAMNEQGHYPSYVFRGYKADIYEGGHRIPFLVRWPGRVKAGSSSAETVCLTDLLATCAGILGATLPANAGEDSYDIRPALFGESGPPIREATVYQAGDGSYSIRQGQWKLELTPSSGGYGTLSAEEAKAQGLPPIQLYDLDSDIGETTNVQARHPDVVGALGELLERYRQQARSAPRA